MRAGCESPWATATCALVALAACSGSVTSDSHAPRGNPAAFAITHVTVIDMSGAPPKPEMTVVISGDRIDLKQYGHAFKLPRVKSSLGKS